MRFKTDVTRFTRLLRSVESRPRSGTRKGEDPHRLLALDRDGPAARLAHSAMDPADAGLVGLAAALVLIGILRLFDLPNGLWLAGALATGLLVSEGLAIALRPSRAAGHRPPIRGAILFAAASLAGALALAFLPDTSWDGMSYHFPSVLRIASGWNPLLGPTDIVPANIYPNGAWTLLAAAGTLIGSLDGGRILKWLILAISARLLSRLLSSWIERTGWRRLLTLALVVNPVVTAQLWTFYLDDLVYLLSVCCFCLCIEFLRRPRWHTVLPLCASVLLLGLTKLYGVYYAGVAIVAAIACLGFRPHAAAARIGAPAVLILCAMLVFVGWRPFITGWAAGDLRALLGHHPIYEETPVNLRSLPYPLAFPVSIFSASGGRRAEPAHLKPPFLITPSEIYFMAAPDTRAGGFGPFYSGACVLSLLLWVEAFRLPTSNTASRRNVLASGIAVGVVVLVACMAFPVNWWARMVPVGWVLPLLPVVVLEAAAGSRRGRRKLLGIGVVGLCLANASLAFVGNGGRTLYRWWDISYETAVATSGSTLVGLAPAPEGWMHVTVAHWLQEAGYDVRLLEPGGCREPALMWRRMQLCPLQ